MSEFKEIKTQEEFEQRLAERLSQKERSVRKEYEDYFSPDDVKKIKEDYQGQIDTLSGDKVTLETQIKDYKEKAVKYETDSVKTRIAAEMGIPFELIDRLKGETEDDLRKDAELLSSYSKVVPPLANTETTETNDEYKKLLKDLEV